MGLSSFALEKETPFSFILPRCPPIDCGLRLQRAGGEFECIKWSSKFLFGFSDRENPRFNIRRG
ncbi:hypothetical protein LR48_Vigan04g097400 [Vigna angularis]|uniref:Uncharacterized protein n=1 Tax=Phaseolus angularis TaxID=3914 RepID=A0A0L9UDH6_PHAAN|nr:hypothetical protein LR48_Vigan04g097400 [Vigna angularis]